MELRQLQYFVAVAEELHFGRAAERLHMSQPPLSMQIKNLEEELGVLLFHRTSRSVALTDAGAALLGDARFILRRTAAAAETARSIARGDIGSIEVGFVGMAMDAFLPEAMREFLRSYPRIKVSLNELSTGEQLEAVRSGRLHVGIVRLYEHDLSGLESQLLMRDPYVVALPKGHPLTALKRIPLRQLSGVDMIMYPRYAQPILYDRIVACCEQAGFSPRIAQEAITKRATIALVAAGIGVALVPRSSRNTPRVGVVLRPLVARLPKVEISAVWRQGHVPAPLAALLKTLRKHKMMA